MSPALDLAGRLASAIGAEQVVDSPEQLATYSIDDLIPAAVVRPISPEQAAEIVRFALAEKLALVPGGSRTKYDLGMPPERYDIALDMTALKSIVHFDPGDLTLSVDAGIPLRELNDYLQQHGQFLPLAVPCFETSTAGGTIASGIDSALRLQYGTARDFLIGAEFIDGTGNLCKSGGRVVKNVTGYDLHKLLIGSLGTLAAITRLNFRTFPLPESFGGHVAIFSSLTGALEYRAAIEQSGLPLANLELVSPKVLEIVQAILRREGHPFPFEFTPGQWAVYAAFEGSEAVVQRIARELEKVSQRQTIAHGQILDRTQSETLGGMLREALEWLRWAAPAVAILRITLLSPRAVLLDKVSALAGSEQLLQPALLLRAAGITYFALLAAQDTEPAHAAMAATVSEVWALAKDAGGHANLLHAPASVKRQLAGTSLVNPAMQQRIKSAFDPSGVFAPGRVVGGI